MGSKESGQEDNDEDSDTMEIDGASSEESGQEDNDEDSETMEVSTTQDDKEATPLAGEAGSDDNNGDEAVTQQTTATAEGVVVVTVHNPEPPKLGIGSLRLALKRSRDLNAAVP